MPANYSNLSLDKLIKEKAKIEKAISAKEATDKKEAMTKLKALARESGIDLSELSTSRTRKPRVANSASKKKTARGTKKVSAKRGKVAPKYRNPTDPGITWTGRGRQPIWVRDHLDNGGTIESIAI